MSSYSILDLQPPPSHVETTFTEGGGDADVPTSAGNFANHIYEEIPNPCRECENALYGCSDEECIATKNNENRQLQTDNRQFETANQQLQIEPRQLGTKDRRTGPEEDRQTKYENQGVNMEDREATSKSFHQHVKEYVNVPGGINEGMIENRPTSNSVGEYENVEKEYGECGKTEEKVTAAESSKNENIYTHNPETEDQQRGIVQPEMEIKDRQTMNEVLEDETIDKRPCSNSVGEYENMTLKNETEEKIGKKENVYTNNHMIDYRQTETEYRLKKTEEHLLKK